MQNMRRTKPAKGEKRMEAMPDEKQIPGKKGPESMYGEKWLPDGMRSDVVQCEKKLPGETRAGAMPDSGQLAARLREETTELLALLPAARKAAAGGPAGGETALDGMARAAYRVLRIAENMEACAVLAAGTAKAVPICVTALAAAYVNGAAGVCRAAVFRPEWPREPLWSLGCARLFAAALGNLLANAVQYGGERPAISVWARKSGAHLLLTVADNGAGYTALPETENGQGLAVVRQYAAAFGGQLLVNGAPGQGARFTLCLPLCAPGAANPAGGREAPSMQDAANPSGAQGERSMPDGTTRPSARKDAFMPGKAHWSDTQGTLPMQGTENPSGGRGTPFAPPIPPDYMADRFSPLYVQLAPVCDLPL